MRIKLLFILFGALFFQNFLYAENTNIHKLSQKSLSQLKPPKLEKVSLNNGVPLYFYKEENLPLFEMTILVQSGQMRDPKNLKGLGSLTASLIRTGGSFSKKPYEVDQFLESRAASLSISMQEEYAQINLRGLSEDAEELIKLTFELLKQPRFDADQFDLTKKRFAESLLRLKDDPTELAELIFKKQVYEGVEYKSDFMTRKSLSLLSLGQVKEYYQNYFHPNHFTYAVSGNLDFQKVLALINQEQKTWPFAAKAVSEMPAQKKEWKTKIYLVPKEGSQTTLLVGHLGDKRFNPDKFALMLMNQQLGGDIFSSKLGQEIRSAEGLAYSVYSHFGLETDYGLFYVMAQTRNEGVMQTLKLIQKNIDLFHAGKGMSEQTLQYSKDASLNRLVNQWEPVSQYVRDRARLNFLAYPENYLEQYAGEIKKVTLADIKKVAHDYLFPTQLVIVVVGDQNKLEKSLSSLGKLQIIPIESVL